MPLYVSVCTFANCKYNLEITAHSIINDAVVRRFAENVHIFV